ncbi:MAG TPA: hypothetical protein VNS32_13770, partial [Flavisolibacter sp.]|nr:hypothetical protein [Flavisolibacter sp.]
LIKIPLQFFILLIGVLIFAFYQFNAAPITFNDSLIAKAHKTQYNDSLNLIENRYTVLSAQVDQQNRLLHGRKLDNSSSDRELLQSSVLAGNQQLDGLRKEYKAVLQKALPDADVNDTNYIFLSFVKSHIPQGLRGLLIAIIFIASWGSIAAALNSLAASTMMDFHKRISKRNIVEKEYVISRYYTLAWGGFSILIAQFAHQLGQSLIEAVNVLGSLFYGVILGIFLVAFYAKKINGTATFIAALITEVFVILLFFNEQISFLRWLPDISFLWLNMIGALGVLSISLIIQQLSAKQVPAPVPQSYGKEVI